MANTVRVRTGVDQTASKGLDQLRAKFDALQKQGAKGFVIGAGVAATTHALGLVQSALGGVTDFMGDSVRAASALSESMGKSSVVFGDNADEMEAWADRADTAIGQSKQQALEAAGTFGNLMQAFGEAPEKTAVMSRALVELASDLASFNNTSIDDAIQALRSGLSGETEPLKRYGIAISDARMRSVLLAAGIKDLGATLTPLQKSQAAYTLILKDSTLAQGDFQRTSEGLANQQRSSAAELENYKAEVGEGLLPAMVAWEKGNLDLIRTMNLVTNATEMGAMSTDELVGGMASLIKSLPVANSVLGGFVDEQLESAAAAEKADRALDGAARAGHDWGEAAADAVQPTSAVSTQVRNLRRNASDAASAVDLLSSTISDDLFGNAINEGRIEELKDHRAELIEQRKETKRGSDAYKILTGEIAADDQALFDLQLQMKQKEGPEAVIAFLKRQIAKYGDATGALGALITKMRTLISTQSQLAGSSLWVGYINKTDDILGRHHGGPVNANQPYIVGEKGPEIMVPKTSGTILPNDVVTNPAGTVGNSAFGLAGGNGVRAADTGQPVVIQLEVDRTVLARLVDQRLRYMRGRTNYLPD